MTQIAEVVPPPTLTKHCTSPLCPFTHSHTTWWCRYGAPDQPLRVLSLGGGIQSSCLLLMACEDAIRRRAGQHDAALLPRLDAAIFADTQHEMPETYDYLRYLEEQCEAAGIRTFFRSAGDLKADLIARRGKGMQPNLPVRVRDPKTGELSRVNAYRCSYDYKRRVVTRATKELCGGRGAWKRLTVEQWLGISMDESSRMKPADACRCGHNRLRRIGRKERRGRGDGALVELIHDHHGCARCACTGFDPWQRNEYPLVDLRMSRAECVGWITDHGHPTPPRSACYFCPNRGNAHWRYLRDHRPDLWASAVEVDEFVRDGMNELDGQGFLHQSGVPLAVADLRTSDERLADRGVLALPGLDGINPDVDNDCDAGTCFT